MLNHVETVQSPQPGRCKVVVVNMHPSGSHRLETILDAMPCDVVFVESTAHAYSQIKRVSPDLVIVCLEIDDRDGFLVLSMLKLDSRTREIPVVICTMEPEAGESADSARERDERVFIQSHAGIPIC